MSYQIDVGSSSADGSTGLTRLQHDAFGLEDWLDAADDVMDDAKPCVEDVEDDEERDRDSETR